MQTERLARLVADGNVVRIAADRHDVVMAIAYLLHDDRPSTDTGPTSATDRAPTINSVSAHPIASNRTGL